ncbi:MAG: Hsp20 family protein [Bdellovibrionota bacterium]
MSITRSGMGPFNPAAATGNRRTNFTTPEDAARAEKEARDRIARAQEETQRAEASENQEIDQMHDHFEQMYTKESINNEAELEKVKTEGYEKIRNLQRAQQAEARRIQRTGERDINKLQEHFRDTKNHLEEMGKEETTALLTGKKRELDYERNSSNMELEHLKTESGIQQQELREKEEYKYAELLKAARGRYDQMREKSVQQTENEAKHFDERYKDTVETHDKLVNRIESHAASDVEAIRRRTTDGINAYSSRQSDPFYHMKSISGRVYDEGDQYVLMAKIPEHEREHVTVSIKGEQVVLSGYRRSNDTKQEGPGHTRSTAAFQSYTESFPLYYPVDSRGIRKEFDGDTMVVSIPKKSRYATRQGFQAPPPNKARVEGPKFPPDLHIPAETQAVQDPPERTKRDRDSGTLS